jgi:hypothetical protein
MGPAMERKRIRPSLEKKRMRRERVGGGEEDKVGWLRTAVHVLLPSMISAVVP